MIAELLKDWKGEIRINNTTVDLITTDFNTLSNEAHIYLHTANKSRIQDVVDRLGKEQYKITVKKYMTETSSPGFDFMAKWNNDNPMPLRTMIGVIEKETRGMVYMKLHGQAEPVIRCMRCGRTLTNPVSKMYGIGPECITKVPFIMNLDMGDVEEIKKRLENIVWEGWIIKSAIIEQEKSCT